MYILDLIDVRVEEFELFWMKKKSLSQSTLLPLNKLQIKIDIV